jgi:hypothetical protein
MQQDQMANIKSNIIFGKRYWYSYFLAIFTASVNKMLHGYPAWTCPIYQSDSGPQYVKSTITQRLSCMFNK